MAGIPEEAEDVTEFIACKEAELAGGGDGALETIDGAELSQVRIDLLVEDLPRPVVGSRGPPVDLNEPIGVDVGDIEAAPG
ncbi:MAG: hypothetical protein AB7G11_14405 [Phycisphaerales bacterium]